MITYSGAGDKVGDSYHWKGNSKVGEGEQSVTETVVNDKFVTKLHFIAPFEGDAVAKFVLTPEGNGTKVFLTEGEYDNIKITRTIDMVIAERILADRLSFQ